MRSQQQTHTTSAADGDEVRRHDDQHPGIAGDRLTRTDRYMIMTILAVGLLMGYLALIRWLPEFPVAGQ
jgi:hypothetical protein